MQQTQLRPEYYFDLSNPDIARLFAGINNVWEVVAHIPELVLALTKRERRIEGSVSPSATLENDASIVIEKGATIDPGVHIVGPAYIGKNVAIKHGAYIRENVILLEGSSFGHSCEAKDAIFLPNARASHFCYIGNSIIGDNVNLGGGTKLGNLEFQDPENYFANEFSEIKIEFEGKKINTGMSKLGAIIGDNVQTGTDVTTNPGCFIGKNCVIYGGTNLKKGFYPTDRIIKLRQQIEIVEKLR